MNVAVVTGALGFIGSVLTRRLEADGWEVRGIDLHAGDGVTVGDIAVRGPWVEAYHGADVVFHTAAIVGELGGRDDYWRVNVVGTRNVCEAALEAGVARLAHVSSWVVYGDGYRETVDEASPVRPTGSPYTDTKISAEHQVLRAVAEDGLSATVVRFGDVYGPGSQQWVVRQIELLRRRILSLPNGGHGVLMPTYIDDAVDGLVAAGTHARAAGEIVNINGGRPVAFRDFIAPYASEMGVRPISMPTPLVRATATALELGARALDRQPLVSRHAVEYVTSPAGCSIDKARRLLGWSPSVDLDEGMRRTLEWARAEGLLA